jgi:hypothetical protein
MSSALNRQLQIALSNDLNKPGSKRFAEVIDDDARKTFTATVDGVVFEFSHKQPDSAYWNGVKYYGSGKRGRIRFPRTQAEAVPTVPTVSKKLAQNPA